MSTLQYASDGIYPEIKGIMDTAEDNANLAVYYSHLLVLDDFPQVDYVRNQLTPDIQQILEELLNIKKDIQITDSKISELTDDINKGSQTIEISTPEPRKRMIL